MAKIFVLALAVLLMFQNALADSKPYYCFLNKDAGPCTSFVSQYYFSPEKNDCIRFDYGGCAGNKNRFNTYPECYIACARGQGDLNYQPGTIAPSPLPYPFWLSSRP